MPDHLLIANPKIYEQGRLGTVYKPYSFWVNMVDSLYQSLVIYYVAHFAYLDSTVDIWEFGTVICTMCLFVMLLHLAIETKSWVSFCLGVCSMMLRFEISSLFYMSFY